MEKKERLDVLFFFRRGPNQRLGPKGFYMIFDLPSRDLDLRDVSHVVETLVFSKDPNLRLGPERILEKIF